MGFYWVKYTLVLVVFSQSNPFISWHHTQTHTRTHTHTSTHTHTRAHTHARAHTHTYTHTHTHTRTRTHTLTHTHTTMHMQLHILYFLTSSHALQRNRIKVKRFFNMLLKCCICYIKMVSLHTNSFALNCVSLYVFIKLGCEGSHEYSTGTERVRYTKNADTHAFYLFHQFHADCSLYYPLYHINLKTQKNQSFNFMTIKGNTVSFEIHHCQVRCAFTAWMYTPMLNADCWD